MEKKKYTRPSLAVVPLSAQQLLSYSLTNYEKNDANTSTVGDSEES